MEKGKERRRTCAKKYKMGQKKIQREWGGLIDKNGGIRYGRSVWVFIKNDRF